MIKIELKMNLGISKIYEFDRFHLKDGLKKADELYRHKRQLDVIRIWLDGIEIGFFGGRKKGTAKNYCGDFYMIKVFCE